MVYFFCKSSRLKVAFAWRFLVFFSAQFFCTQKNSGFDCQNCQSVFPHSSPLWRCFSFKSALSNRTVKVTALQSSFLLRRIFNSRILCVVIMCEESVVWTPRWQKEISLLFYTDNNLPKFLRVLLQFLYSSVSACAVCYVSLAMTLKHFQHIKSEIRNTQATPIL